MLDVRAEQGESWSEAIAEALASVRAAGLEPSPYGLELLEAVATGEIDIDEAVEALRGRYQR